MAELAREVITPGPGQCLLHNIGGRLFVERADPVVAIATGLIRQVFEGNGHADMRLDGHVLVICGSNAEVRYRLERSGRPDLMLGTLALPREAAVAQLGRSQPVP